MEEQIMAQSLSRILIHTIFSTKDRFPFLSDADVRKRTHSYIATIFNELESPAIEVGGVEDHVHVLCALSRNHSISEIIKNTKANSSSWAKALGGRCWKFSWQAGYGAFSIHPSQVDSLQRYIQNQAEHHRRRTFQEEYLAILNHYKVEYDERYLWA
jgi:REP element-mobilizing transposase RayT